MLAAAAVFSAAVAVAQQQLPELSHELTRLPEPVPAPVFALKDMDGEPHSLSDYRGKVVMLNFWATWCPPCRREMPSLERLHQSMSEEPFMVLAVNQFEDPDLVFAYMGQLNVFPTFPILFDPDSSIAEDYGVKGLPTTVLIDSEGRIRYRAIGGREFDHPEVEAVIRDLIDEGRTTTQAESR
jgi:thiol-disulfide isomerase/thioredoxin